MPYKIIGWEKYQGRKSRGHNPWVKLYKSILSSVSFSKLSDKHKWQSILLLCLADDGTGFIEYSDEEIAYKLRVKEFDPKPFLGTWLQDVDTSGTPVATSGIPEVDQRHARSSTSTSTSVVDQEEMVGPNWQTVQGWFKGFWKVYPKKQSKKDAEKAFKAIPGLNEALLEKIVAAVKAASLSEQWAKDRGMFIPLPATYIRGQKWEDELNFGRPVIHSEQNYVGGTPFDREPGENP